MRKSTTTVLKRDESPWAVIEHTGKLINVRFNLNAPGPDGKPIGLRVVEDLKTRLQPPASRKWDPNKYHWVIWPEHENLVRVIAAKWGFSIGWVSQSFHVLYVSDVEGTTYNGSVIRMFTSERNDWSLYGDEAVILAWFAAHPLPVAAPPVTLPDFTSHYKAFDIDAAADAATVKKAFRLTIRKWHPDVCNHPSAAEVAQKLTAAYGTLADPIRRKQYDKMAVFASKMANYLPPAPTMAPKAEPLYLRTGIVTVEYRPNTYYSEIKSIIDWKPLVNENGRCAVMSSVDTTTNTPRVEWEN